MLKLLRGNDCKRLTKYTIVTESEIPCAVSDPEQSTKMVHEDYIQQNGNDANLNEGNTLSSKDQGVVTLLIPVELSVTGIKMQSTDQNYKIIKSRYQETLNHAIKQSRMNLKVDLKQEIYRTEHDTSSYTSTHM